MAKVLSRIWPKRAACGCLGGRVGSGGERRDVILALGVDVCDTVRVDGSMCVCIVV